ncbi:MAG TPA: oxygen-independent coproporphyrinogen III oxidase [Opitutaceae bacterium]|nr:oxygen-independent coproporphyrinogen III oxidase [Opitutaceae bacterium]
MVASNSTPAASPAAAEFDLGLVRKYNVPGPRYTSYPTAPQFKETVPLTTLTAAIERDNREARRPISLYFHLPFCETLCWFCGCTTVITLKRDAASDYLDYLDKELGLIQPFLNPARRVVQMHFGGGTPTFLPPAVIRRLGEAIHARFQFAPDSENSVEVDPRRITRDHVRAFRELGCNRASLGVQDTNPVVQLAVHRVQPMDVTRQAFEWMRAEGYHSISIDLIFGLPHQTADSFARTIDEVLTLQPDRLAVFSYAHVPWLKPSQRIFEKQANLPSTEEKLRMLATAVSKLTQAGMVYIGMDHFARANDELAVAQREGTLQRNFQGYSTHAGASIYGFGMSSISQTDEAYRQNRKELPAYYAALDAGRLPVERGLILSEEDRLRRHVIMRIMCDRRLSYARLSEQLGVDFRSRFGREIASLADLEADGLLRRDDEGFVVTGVGALLIRIIAMRFDAYLEKGPRRFSRTV